MQRRLTFLFASLLAVACSEGPVGVDGGVDADVDAAVFCADEDPGTPRAVFVLPRDGTEPLFDLPFPSDLRLTPEGTVDISTFPNPRRNTFVQSYVDAYRARQRGFGTNGAIYFRFSHPVDPATLPNTPEQSTGATASAFLVDVDPASPTFGARHPLVFHYQECQTRFWPAHTVAMRPVYGIPLASARRYAAVITTQVKQPGGGDFARDADLEAVLGTGGDAAVTEARALYADALTALEGAGVPSSEILAATVFTTQDAVGELFAIRDWMRSQYPPPAIVGAFTVQGEDAAMTEVIGHYGPVPIFQEGTIPYTVDGGAIDLDASGEPTVHGSYDARFSLAIPRTPMPVNGYPVVLYAHGTGGDFRSYLSDEGQWLAPLGYAVMGVDQIHHGERNPTDTDPGALFFNFTNPEAGRDNNRQSALDVVQQARLIGEFEIPNLGGRPEPVRFDRSRIYFMGHSQGGLNGPIYMAIDDSARGGVLSAASGVITIALVEKTEPAPGIPTLVVAALGLPGTDTMEAFAIEGFTVEHPIATLVQTWIEVSDGTNYAHLIFQSPRAGFAPKSVLMTEGLMDAYAPPAAIEALAGSMFVPQVRPVHSPIDALRLRGIDVLDAPVSANVAGGMATAGILQFPNDGHFAIYDNATARDQVVGFFQSMLDGSVGTIPAP